MGGAWFGGMARPPPVAPPRPPPPPSQASWLALNRPYPGVVDALRGCDAPWYVVSSKSEGRVAALMEAALGVPGFGPGSPRLFAGLQPPDEKKVEALREIAARPLVASAGATLTFIDDRAATLAAVAAAPGLQAVRLLWATWGYAGPGDAQAAAAAGAAPLSLPDFCELLKFGLLMGVDDGCEPSPAEVDAGVGGMRRGGG